MTAVTVLDGGITIAICYGDHNPPHFHATQAEHEFRVEIAAVAVFAGDNGPTAMVRQVLDWARVHQAELAECWARASTGQKPVDLHTIKFVKPLSLGRLQVFFEGDSNPVINLQRFLDLGGVFEPLRDPERFEMVEVGPRGRTILWHVDDDVVDLCADALWLMAHPEEAPEARRG
jgi:hypothetical protein